MKIVQINADYNKGSIGRTTYEIHQYLCNNGHESYVFSCDTNDPLNNVFQIGNLIDHKIHAFFSKLFGRQGYFSHIPTYRLLKKLDKINPDLLQLRNLHSNYINFPMLLKYISKKNIASVITLHDCWFLTGKCCYYTQINCNKWQNVCGNCPALKKDNVSWFFDTTKSVHKKKISLLNAIPNLAIVGNSEWTTEQGRLSAIKNAKFIQRIYNWIDMDTFKYCNPQKLRNRLSITDKDFVVLGVANGWSERKGLNVFIHLAQKLPNLKFILVGSILRDVKLPNNVIKVGKTNNTTELCEYYSVADVFLNPSSQETFGKVTAEAMCCGTPIIVNKATANPELVGPGCGYIVNNNDIDEYVGHIYTIMKNGKSFYSHRCIKYVHENFNKFDRIQDYIELYSKMVKQ